MNTTELLKLSPSMPAAVWRVRSRIDGMTGTVIDVSGDGWIYWFGDDKACRATKADSVETIKS